MKVEDANAEQAPMSLPRTVWEVDTGTAFPHGEQLSAMAAQMARQCRCGSTAHAQCVDMYNQLVEHAPRFVPNGALICQTRWVGVLWVCSPILLYERVDRTLMTDLLLSMSTVHHITAWSWDRIISAFAL